MNNQFMKRAIELSREHMNLGHGGPFGAVIVKDGKVIAEGWNQVTSQNDPTAHAEVTVIRRACEALNNFDLQGCEIYSSCEPCPMCLAAIYWARIDKIFYANTRQDAASVQFDDEFLYEELVRPIKARKIPMVQLDRDDAFTVFEEWDKKTNKIQY